MEDIIHFLLKERVFLRKSSMFTGQWIPAFQAYFLAFFNMFGWINLLHLADSGPIFKSSNSLIDLLKNLLDRILLLCYFLTVKGLSIIQLVHFASKLIGFSLVEK